MYYENVSKDGDGNLIASGLAVDTAGKYYVLVNRYKKATPQSVNTVNN
jgi:hypothetical protein